MKKKNFANSFVLIAVACIFAMSNFAIAAQGDIQILFKLDPRITKSLYMGERWVSPQVFTQVGEGSLVIVEAKVVRDDGAGRFTTLNPNCSASNSDVKVTLAPGNIARITVTKEGTGSLVVGGKSFRLEAKAVNGALQVTIR